MRVAIYARYSDNRQNARSIEDQVAVCTELAQARGWTVAGAYTDAAISGEAMVNRPGLLAALAAAEARAFDALLVEDEDRVARSLEHLAHVVNRLTYAGARLTTLTTEKVETIHVAFKGMIGEDFLRNLRQKTRRGMRSNAEKGLATGSRTYGYRSEPGGAMAIVDSEAAIVRRIFAEFADGKSARAVAYGLNEDAIPGPSGKPWSGSTLSGWAKRGNGVLRTELYAGVKVWNRFLMSKDPATGRRISSCIPPAEWKRTPVPHLTIVDDATWRTCAARLAREEKQAPLTLASARRPGLFTGLWRCGTCGASYTSRHGDQLGCSARIAKGGAVCGQARTIGRREAERTVLEGLRERLLAPEMVAHYVRAYHQAWAAIQARQTARRAPLEAKAGELGRAIERIVDAIVRGVAGPAMEARLVALETERAGILAQIEAAAADERTPPMTLHPRAADGYRARIAKLQAVLAAAGASGARVEQDRELTEAVRQLVDRIEVRVASAEKRAPVELYLHGRLTPLLAAAVGDQEEGRYLLVAGGGYRHAPPAEGMVLYLPLAVRAGSRK